MGLRKAASISIVTAVLGVIFIAGFQNCGNVSLTPHRDLPSYARNVVMTVDYSDSAVDPSDGTHKRRSITVDDELKNHTVSMYFDDSLGNFEQRPDTASACPVRNPPNPTYFSINFRNNVIITACTYTTWDGFSGNCPAWYTTNINSMIPLIVNTNRIKSVILWCHLVTK